jgi:predicted MFS family arabinose efflux permease
MPGEESIHTLTLVTAMIAMDSAFCLIAALHFIRPTASADTIPATNGVRALRAAFGNRYLRRLCAVVAIPMGTFMALATYAQPLLEPAGVSESSAGLILAFTMIAGLLGCAVVPVWAERHRMEVRLMGLGVALTAGACLHLAMVPNTAIAYLTVLAIGFALLPTLPIVLALTERHAPEAEGTAAGLIWLTGNLGGVVIATLVGLLVTTPAIAFVTLAGVTALALPVVRWFGRLEEQTAREPAAD